MLTSSYAAASFDMFHVLSSFFLLAFIFVSPMSATFSGLTRRSEVEEICFYFSEGVDELLSWFFRAQVTRQRFNDELYTRTIAEVCGERTGRRLEARRPEQKPGGKWWITLRLIPLPGPEPDVKAVAGCIEWMLNDCLRLEGEEALTCVSSLDFRDHIVLVPSSFLNGLLMARRID